MQKFDSVLLSAMVTVLWCGFFPSCFCSRRRCNLSQPELALHDCYHARNLMIKLQACTNGCVGSQRIYSMASSSYDLLLLSWSFLGAQDVLTLNQLFPIC